jgi:hypothetical protein
LFAVAEAEQEHEAAQVDAQLVKVVAVVSELGGEAVGECRFLVAGQPVGEEYEQIGELDRVAEVEAELGDVTSSVRWAGRGVG